MVSWCFGLRRFPGGVLGAVHGTSAEGPPDVERGGGERRLRSQGLSLPVPVVGPRRQPTSKKTPRHVAHSGVPRT